jgi:hypothetical protein
MHSWWCGSYRFGARLCSGRAESRELLVSQESHNFSAVYTVGLQTFARAAVVLDPGESNPIRPPRFSNLSCSVRDSYSGAEEFTHHLASRRRNHEWI